MVCDWLTERLGEHSFELFPVSTEIDSRLDYSLEKQGGIGLFTKELDTALLGEMLRLRYILLRTFQQLLFFEDNVIYQENQCQMF